MPSFEDESTLFAKDLGTDWEEFKNYQGIEEGDEAFDFLEGFVNKGYIRKFDSLPE